MLEILNDSAGGVCHRARTVTHLVVDVRILSTLRIAGNRAHELDSAPFAIPCFCDQEWKRANSWQFRTVSSQGTDGISREVGDGVRDAEVLPRAPKTKHAETVQPVRDVHYRCASSCGVLPGSRVLVVYVLHPADWEALELFRNPSGAFDLAHTAIDRAAQKLHGVRVVLSSVMPVGKGLLLDLDAVQLDTDTHGLVIENGTVGDQSARNQKVMLVEGRFGLSVLRPSGVVEIATAA